MKETILITGAGTGIGVTEEEHIRFAQRIGMADLLKVSAP